MVINNIKGRKQSKDTSAVQLQDKNFSTIQYLFDWTHEPCVPTQYGFTFVTW